MSMFEQIMERIVTSSQAQHRCIYKRSKCLSATSNSIRVIRRKHAGIKSEENSTHNIFCARRLFANLCTTQIALTTCELVILLHERRRELDYKLHSALLHYAVIRVDTFANSSSPRNRRGRYLIIS